MNNVSLGFRNEFGEKILPKVFQEVLRITQ